MREEMTASEWQMGLIWLPGFLPHITGVYLTVKLNQYYPKYQWLLAAIGLVLQGTMCVLIPFCKNFGLLMIPISGICFGI
jgi:DHA1 family vesicular acetylcholine transporter-like MFS transporter 3